MLKAGVVQQECNNALFPFYLGLPLISLRFALLWSLTPRSIIRLRALFTICHHIQAFHSPEHMILNGNAFRQNYENYCSGKEYPLKDETKTGAEIHISKFSITEEPICFPFNNRDAQTSHCSKSCSGRIDLRKRIFL